MYFKSLINDELQHFHKSVTVRNFSISLTEILTSKMFKKEQITTDLYRIYPLFYCSKIITNDTSSKILENKCILATTGENEKYFNFITDEDTPVIYDGLDFYTISDKLTIEDFNAFVQILKNKLTITDNIRATDGTVTGEYGEYKFNLADVTIVDNGILITEETLSANPTVKLTHPIFRNSTYTLKLDVFSVSDVNVMEDYNTDNITHDTLEIVLEENTDVEIPLGSLEFNKIVSFNAVIDITHDQPVIQFPGSLELTVETDNYIDSTVYCTVIYKDDAGALLTRETVKLRDGDTVLATSTTDDEGVATFEYTPTQDKEYNFNVASEDGLTSNYISKTIVKHPANITVSTTKNLVYIPSSFVFSGVVSSNYGVMENATLKIMNNNEVIGTAYTNALGEYSREIECNTTAEYNLKAVYEGDDVHYSSNSSFVNVVARKLNTNVTINSNKSTVYYGQSVTITGVLKDELGNKLSDTTVKLYNGSSQLATGTTNSNGEYSFTETLNEGTYSLKVVYDGDNSHSNCNSSSISIIVRKLNTNITINTDKNVVYHSQSLVISGVLKDELGVPISGATVTLKGGSSDSTRTTNSNGEYSFIRNYSSAGGDYGKTFNYYVVYAGDNSHAGVTSSTKSIPVRKAPTSISTTLPSEIYVGDTIPIKVVSSYGSFNPSGVTVKLYQPGDTHHWYPETTNLTQKDSSGNFNYTIPGNYTGYYDIEIIYDGNNDYESSSKSGNMHIIEADVGSITLRKSGTTVYAKFKDKNGNALANTNFSNIVFYITIGSQTHSIIVESVISDANGDISLTGITYSGSIYATYGDITSNTISF